MKLAETLNCPELAVKIGNSKYNAVYILFQDTQLVAGVAFKKSFSYAGFEMQPKKYVNPKIALLNIELELKSEKENAEVRVNTVEVRVVIFK